MKIKQKIIIISLQFILLMTGMIFSAKPAYHFLKREYLRLQASERWKKALTRPGVGEEYAWLSAPSANIDIMVLNSDRKEDLYDFPVYKKIGKNLKVFMAHRDIHFSKLGKIKTGNQVNLQLRNSQKNSYRVVDFEILNPDEVEKRLKSKSDKEWLVLMTCYPFQYIGPAPKRYLLWCKSKADIPVRLENHNLLMRTKFWREKLTPGLKTQ